MNEVLRDRYRLVEQLGEGGMGIVYRAFDTRLEREVAIKVLRGDTLSSETARERFRKEARALSRLNHTNVAMLFDFDCENGRDFIVLEYVPGETLWQLLRSGPLPEARARAIALEVAEALGAAHEQGIVHRDLKPSNVALTPRGHAKVLDFGLARFLSSTGGETLIEDPTRTTDFLGTLPYMAPEQLTDGPVDARTDLFSFGILLYEMTTGIRPFGDDAPGTVVARIVGSTPRRPTELRPGLSSETEAIILRCLEKEPARRFPDAPAIARALRGGGLEGVSGGAVATASLARAVSSAASAGPADRSHGIRAIAVLPFENLSGDPAQEFFADGMTDALIADLAQIGALRVISRTSAMRYKGTRTPLPQIARDLGVEAIVEGSAAHSGERAHITARLIDATTENSLWSKSYERNLTDLLTLQREVARAIAEEIRIQVTPEERARLARAEVAKPTAHLAYLKGRYLWNKWNTESIQESLKLYEDAIAADPEYALAYAGLADSYTVLGNTNAVPPDQAYPKARSAALKGLAIDDSRAELHASLGYVIRFYDWDWPRAEREFLKAIELNPGYANAHRWYGQLLSGLGRHEEALAQTEYALELDPLSLIIHTAVGDVLFYARRYEDAVSYYRRCIEIDPTFGPGRTDMARALEMLGRSEEALAEYVSVQPKRPDGRPVPSTGLVSLLARAGRRAEAEEMVEELIALSRTRFVSPYGIASYYAVTGQKERALEWLEKAYAQRDGTLIWIKVHPRMDVLRGEPAFRDLLERMKLYP
ncbi:MAG: protein kinase domain-containing protein [Candidatus Eiseniibacteriota bacterium]